MISAEDGFEFKRLILCEMGRIDNKKTIGLGESYIGGQG